jgi:hypothetical protein
MSDSNWVAIASVIFTSLTAGYATYENNLTNKEVEKYKQESTLAIEKLKQDHIAEIEKIKLSKEREYFLQDRKSAARTEYCNAARSLFKELAEISVAVQDRNIEARSIALVTESKLKRQAIAYIDEHIYESYLEHSKKIDEHGPAMIAALAMQVRKCSATGLNDS